jgi:hypothetical protein
MMPITQDRFHALLLATESIYRKHKALSAAITEAAALPDPAHGIAHAYHAMEYCRVAPEEIETIAGELSHFSHGRRHKNTRDAARRRASRGQSRPGDEAFIGHIATGIEPFRTPMPPLHTPPPPTAAGPTFSHEPTFGLTPDERARLARELADLDAPATPRDPNAPISPRAPTQRGPVARPPSPSDASFETDPDYADPNAPD